MKGLVLTAPKNLEEKELTETEGSSILAKVKITKALLTLNDIMHYNGEVGENNVVLGSYGIGVITETNANFFDVENGKHVYVSAKRPCLECYNCKNNEENKCSDTLTAGEDYDGFLRDFLSVDADKLFVLPDGVSDLDALFIGHISLAISVVDKLNIQKGDYVAIIGANNFANILAQLLIYYQAVPIVLSTDDEDLDIIKKSGIYYTLGSDDNWQKEVSSITGGRMTKSVVYISDCEISPSKAFSVAAFSAGVAFTGTSNKNISVPFAQAIKKQLDIHCISSAAPNTATSINLLANKAINVKGLKFDEIPYSEVSEKLAEAGKKLEKEESVSEIVVSMI